MKIDITVFWVLVLFLVNLPLSAQLIELTDIERPFLSFGEFLGPIPDQSSDSSDAGFEIKNQELTARSSMKSGEYLLSDFYIGEVKTIVFPSFLTDLSSEKMPLPFQSWTLNFERAIVASDRILLIPTRKNDGNDIKCRAVLLNKIPLSRELAVIESVSEYEDLLGPAQNPPFKDAVISKGFGIESIETSRQWVICCVEDKSIRYVRIVLFLEENTLQELNISDRWIQEAILRPRLP